MASQSSNKLLLHRISVDSDKAAFTELFKRYHSKLITFATCFLPNYEEAEDMVSEVFIRLLQNQSQLMEIDNFEGYLYYSVKNQCLNQLKKNKRKSSLFSPIDLQDFKTNEYTQPLEQLVASELRDKIAGCVDRLPHKRRLVYKMIKDDGLKIKEVSKLLDIAEKTVKKHLELAVRDLRAEISVYIETQNSAPKIIPISLKVGSLVTLVVLISDFFKF
ncbi:RNA polymerase sigma factor [Algoriphagus winogradskyi]|uniref:RNA polymerase sigma-70 factor (ECF subfamily) n=2 Tax=Algoriphagus TaxID=246875 RepID=A0A2W7R7F9_9BACT|nr:RNA polymerase sigma-70 factor [Algoriphagus winogradskyi]PZX56783.1 RNA polymerase sigma-70 factor (ECF subfamily) [Algoriphagus chordae]SMP17295.1 RNA polymerase sigma-70 factor, ECF subfamily [Algoriphagus winogradskyi]